MLTQICPLKGLNGKKNNNYPECCVKKHQMNEELRGKIKSANNKKKKVQTRQLSTV